MKQNTERIKVLYLDDEEANLITFRAGFRRDFDVHTVLSAEEALAYLEQNTVHVVISDQRMPGMTGAEFLAEVKKRWPKCARLLLTGFSDIEAVVDAVNLGGIHAYITKPWDPIDLKLRIEQAHEVHALREEKDKLLDKYRQVFEDSGDPIVIMDSKQNIHDLNPAAERLMKADKDTLLAMKLDAFVEDIPGMLRSAAVRREGRTSRNAEIRLSTPDGRALDCLITITRIGESTEGKGLYQAMIKDITDRKQQERELKERNRELDRRVAERTDQLMKALDDLGAFSYSVAHDLRSPLKNIHVLSDHLKNLVSIRAEEEETELVERIRSGSARLINLVDDLLRFARTDSKEVDLQKTDIVEVIGDYLWEMNSSHANVEFITPGPGQAMAYADPAMVRVALTNLLANAVKFTRNEEHPRIEIGHRMDENDDILWVKDNGVGFDNAKNDQLFGVFKRLHSSSKFEGTGIGLALVRRIMKKHGGSCWAEGAPGEGATIFLRFPRKEVPERLRMAS